MSVTIGDICKALDAKVFVEGNSEREIDRVAVGDLLSFVMGSNADGAAWITIQTHLNVAAVAVLKDMPLIIVAADREPAVDLSERCKSEGIAVVSAKFSIFDTCVKLGRLGLVG